MGPNGPRCKDGLVRSVLIEVDKDSLAALLFPPGRSDQVWASALHLARHRNHRSPNFDTAPLRQQANIDMKTAIAGGLDEAEHTSLVEQRFCDGRRLLGHCKCRAGPRIQVDSEFVADVRIRGPNWPRVKAETAHIDSPDHMSQISNDQGVRRGSVRCCHHRSGQPLGSSVGNSLLKEVRAVGTIGKSLKQHRSVEHLAHERFADRQVVTHQIHFGF